MADKTEEKRNVTKMKKKLKRLVYEITLEEEDKKMEKFDECKKLLVELISGSYPSEFLSMILKNTSPVFCSHLLEQFMEDPIILAMGTNCVRKMIQLWLKHGDKTCSSTPNSCLSDIPIKPNALVRQKILRWFKQQPIEGDFRNLHWISKHDDIHQEYAREFKLYLNMISSKYHAQQRTGAWLLRLRTAKLAYFRDLFVRTPEAVECLLHPLRDLAEFDLYLQEDIATTILNISMHENNFEKIDNNVMLALADFVIDGSNSAKATAIKALCQFTKNNESNAAIIIESSALKGLIDLLKDKDISLAKSACSAILLLCHLEENMKRAIEYGAVEEIVWRLNTEAVTDQFLIALELLSKSPVAVKEMIRLRVVRYLLDSIRKTSLDSKWGSYIMILDTISCQNQEMAEMIAEEENKFGTITRVVEQADKVSAVARTLRRKLERGD